MSARLAVAGRALAAACLLLLLAACGGGRSDGTAATAAPPALPPPAQIPPELRGLPVTLERIEFAMTGKTVVGQPDGDILSCLDAGPMLFEYWAENELFTREALEAAAQRDLAAQGFALPAEKGLFQEPGSGGLYAIAGRVEAVGGHYCLHKDLLRTLIVGSAMTSDEFSGEATVEVTWEVFSLLEQRVVYSRRVAAHAEQVEAMPRGYSRAAQAAFLGTLRTLGADPQLHAALRASVAATGAAAAAAPPAGAALTLSAGRPATGGFAAAADRLLAATVLLEARGHGSGFIVSPDGYLLTNAHVVGDLPRIRVELAPGQTVIGEVVRRDARRDVALVKLPLEGLVGKGLTAVAIDPRLPTVGADVYAVGAPLDRALSDSVTKGIVSAIRREADGLTYIQADVDVQAGNSGGPLTDAAGNVIGMAVLGLQPAGGSIGLNFFIPIGEALAALGITLR